MIHSIHKKQSSIAYKILCSFIAVTFGSSVILPPAPVFAQTVLNLPVPGTMVAPSPGFMPVLMTGLTIHPDNPLRFDFIMDTGHSGLDIHSEEFKQESAKLIKYFMASLTTPEEELWVNLSPYEKDRMIPLGLGKTEMGRDMLAQDYLLKQLTASLMYPEEDLGKEFWKRVYQKAQEKFGTTEIPLNTFNKIWIVPEDALVYEQNGSAFVIHSKLAVMLEEDYEALRQSKNTVVLASEDTVVSGLQSQVVREVLIPEIAKEINEGKNFSNLRQIFNALILATWYKVRLKESLLGKVYVNQGKTKGIDVQDKGINEKIYTQYLEAFKKGVYNYIREDYDESTQQIIPRKYFSGGASARMRNGKWFSQFLVAGGLVLGLTAFSALPLSAQEKGKDVLEGVGKQAGVTAEFVENSPNDVTVTVHNGKNVRPVLLAQIASSPVTAQEEYSYYQKAFPGLIRQDPEGKYYIMHNLISSLLPKQKQALAVSSSEVHYESLRDALSFAREEILDSLTIDEVENFDVLYAFLMAHPSIPALQRTIEMKEIIDNIDAMRHGKSVEKRDLRIMDFRPGIRKKVNELLTASQDNERTANKQKPSLEEVLRKFVSGKAVFLEMTDILPGKQSSIPPGSIMVGFLGNDISEGKGIVLTSGEQTAAISGVLEAINTDTLKVRTDTSIYEVKILRDITDSIITGEEKFSKGDILGLENSDTLRMLVESNPSGILVFERHRTGDDGVSQEHLDKQDVRDRVTMGKFKVWRVGASSPVIASPSVAGRRNNVGTFLPLQQVRSEEDWGIGDWGVMKKAVDVHAALGKNIIQLLPFNLSSAGYSPYSLASSRLMDPNYINVESLMGELKSAGISTAAAEAFIEENQSQIEALRESNKVDYAAVNRIKMTVLKMIWDSFKDRREAPLYREFEQFQEMRQNWLPEHLLYVILKNKFMSEKSNGWDWRTWDEPLRDRNPETIKEAQDAHREQLAFDAFVQFAAYRQYTQLREYADRRNVEIMVDMPYALDGADIWLNPGVFGLKKENGYKALVKQGVPPEPAYPAGQYWQFFPFDWDHPDTVPFILERFQYLQGLASQVRLDHVLGYYRKYLFTEDVEGHMTLERLGLHEKIRSLQRAANSLGTEEAQRDAVKEVRELIAGALLKMRENLPEALKGHLPADAIRLTMNEDGDIPDDNMLLIARRVPEDNIGEQLPEGSPWKREYVVEKAVHQDQSHWDFLRLTPNKAAADAGFLYDYLFPGDESEVQPQDSLRLGYFELMPQAEALMSEFLRLAQEQGTPLIWETLGVVPSQIQKSVERLGGTNYIPVIWGEVPRWGEKRNPYYPPHHIENAFATFGLHDSTTMRNRWERELGRETKVKMLDGFFGKDRWTEEDVSALTPRVREKLLDMVYASRARIAVLTWIDLLG